MAPPILGIDFGTSCTSAGVLVGDRVELVQDSGDDVIPSVVWLPQRGNPEIGRRALMRLLGDPSTVVRSVKRIMGLTPGTPIYKAMAQRTPPAILATHPPEQLAGIILDYVRRLAENRFGGPITKAVITASAAPPDGYAMSLKRAARIAHLEVVASAPEPIAAALGVGLHAQQAERRLLICDFGGGTFDVSALVQQGLRFTTIAAHGDAALGGDDLDDAVAEALASFVYKRAHYDLHKDQVRWNELLLRCETAKRQLSSSAEAPLIMRDAYLENGQRKDLSIVLDRPWVEHCWRPLFDRAVVTVRETLVRAKWTVKDVDAVALVGGASLVPLFQRAISDVFPGKVSIAPRADIAVAVGAALLTARFAATPRPVPVLEAAAS